LTAVRQRLGPQAGTPGVFQGQSDMTTQVRSEINVTPLVDVAMVVLIIFMVVTPLIKHGPDVSLPETPHPEAIAENAGRIALTLRADGSVFLDELPLPRTALLGALRGRDLEGAEILVRADGRLPYGEVRDVLEMLADAGLKSAGLETVRAR
jgi:biopolymer transport protein TolR